MSHNILWKIISFLFAITLWFFVVMTQNPVLSQEYNDIPLSMTELNEIEKGSYVILNREDFIDKKIDVVVKGPRLQVDKIQRNLHLLNAKLDFSDVIGSLETSTSDYIESKVKVTTFLSVTGVSVQKISCSEVPIQLEKKSTITVPVEYIITGDEANKYVSFEPIIKPKEVVISGPISKVNTIEKAYVEIDAKQLDDEILNYNLPIKIAGNGEEITSLMANPSTVNVVVPKGIRKTVPLEIDLQGDLPSSYGITNVISNPSEITIVGPEDIVNGIDSIKTTPISMDGRIETFREDVDIVLPEGVERVEYQKDQVGVMVEVKKRKIYTYKIPTSTMKIEKVGVKKGEVVKIISSSVNVSLSATAEELLLFNSASVTGKIDVTGLNVGKHKVLVEMKVPKEFEIQEKEFLVDISIEKKTE